LPQLFYGHKDILSNLGVADKKSPSVLKPRIGQYHLPWRSRHAAVTMTA
jgi:hypothetical protein